MTEEPWYAGLSHRLIFFALYGPGPHYCVFCDEPIVNRRLIVHHLDHDHDNDVPENLAP